MPYDLFISYSRRDNAQGRITQLIEWIKRDFAAFAGRELVPFFDHHEIVRLLGCFTLAVESAAVYLGQFAHDVTCAAFLARLKAEGLEGLDAAASQSSEGVLHGEKRLGVTLRTTFERLDAPELLALWFAALLPADHVALPWLRVLVAKTFPEMARDADPGHPDPWKNLLRRLFSLRLLQSTGVMDADGQPLVVRVHRLVQQLMLRDCPAPERTELQLAVNDLATQRAAVLEKTTNWVEARWELEPFTALAGLFDESNHPKAAWLLSHAEVRWHHLAEWSRAEPLTRRALAVDEKRFGPEHPEVATDLNNLATLLQATNRLAEAEPLMRLALAIDEERFGLEHPDVATDVNNLAILYFNTNRPAEVEPLTRRMVEIFLKFTASTGHQHPHLQTVTRNYAALLSQMGRSPAEVQAQLNAVARPYGLQFGGPEE